MGTAGHKGRSFSDTMSGKLFDPLLKTFFPQEKAS